MDSTSLTKPEVTWGDHGDILLRNFYKKETDTVVDVRLTNCDVSSYDNITSKKCLSNHERSEKRKYLQVCLEQRMHFSPLIFGVDGMVRRETKDFVKRLAKHRSSKWEQPLFTVIDYLLTCLSIACVRATHRMTMGSRILV